MSKVLVHICCGVCASSAMEQLREERFEVKGLFYNPNIYPLEEYERRLEVARRVSKILDFQLIEGEYDKERWFRLIEGLENEPEGGKRCETCFKMRLEEASRKSKESDIPFIATTLTVSPHKDASMVNEIGMLSHGSNFLERDFKKKNGFKKTITFAKRYNLYQQHYCGCIYSKMKPELMER